MRLALLVLVACAKPPPPPVVVPDYAAEDLDGELVDHVRQHARVPFDDIERAVGLNAIFRGSRLLVADPEHVDEAPPREGEMIYWLRPIVDDERHHVVGVDATHRVFFALTL